MTQINAVRSDMQQTSYLNAGLNRLAAVSQQAKSKTTPAATSAARVKLGSVHSGQGNDRISGDYPLVNGKPTLPSDWQKNPVLSTLAKQLSNKSDAELFKLFGAEYGVATQFNEARISQLERFRSSTGGTVVSQPSSTMSKLVAGSAEGQNLGSELTSRLQSKAKELLKTNNTVDVNKLAVKIGLGDRLSWGMNPTNPMFGLVGSTDGLSADLLNAKYDGASGRLTGTMRITVSDRFGLSNQDNDSPGQVAMWLLQHQRGYKSFENKIVYDLPVDVSVREPRDYKCNPRANVCPVP